MSTPETSREPCPDRILDDLGGAFSMGAVGGTAFHFLKGLYNSPNGHRLSGAATAVRLNAPRLGGSFAVWGGLFSSFDCTLVYLRQKEDPWNSIIAGAATGGFLAMRRGLRPAAGSALFGGILLAGIEGAGIMLNRLSGVAMPPPHQQYEEANAQSYRPDMAQGGSPWFGVFGGKKEEAGTVQSYRREAEEGSSSWFGWFGGGGKKEERKSEVMESFDGQGAKMPSFEFK